MKLLLIFTRGVGLTTWNKVGNLKRELIIYNRMIEENFYKKIYFFTYEAADAELSKTLKNSKIMNENIIVINKPEVLEKKFLSNTITSLYFLLFFNKIKKNCHIIKTNQIDGSLLGVLIKKIYKKKFYLRSGYSILKRDKVLKVGLFRKILNSIQSNIAIKNADIISVSNLFEKKFYNYKYNKKVNLIYNFIDTSLFYNFNETRNGKFLYIGRISHEKNIAGLIKLFQRNKNCQIDLYGQRNIAVKKIIIENTKNINFFDPVNNDQLPKILNQYSYIILPSKFEGLSKVLLESMACGIFCITSNLIENKFLIKDKKSGLTFRDISKLDLNYIKGIDSVKTKIFQDANISLINKYFTLDKYYSNEKIIHLELIKKTF